MNSKKDASVNAKGLLKWVSMTAGLWVALFWIMKCTAGDVNRVIYAQDNESLRYQFETLGREWISLNCNETILDSGISSEVSLFMQNWDLYTSQTIESLINGMQKIKINSTLDSDLDWKPDYVRMISAQHDNSTLDTDLDYDIGWYLWWYKLLDQTETQSWGALTLYDSALIQQQSIEEIFIWYDLNKCIPKQ